MKRKAIRTAFWGSALGAVLTMACGLLLWKTSLGDRWVNASYDYFFRFGARAPSNNVVLILMDDEAYDHFHQTRGTPWDRALHAQLLRRLAADGCGLVVFDSFFRNPGVRTSDEALAEAMRRQGRVVLMAEQAAITHPTFIGARPILPAEAFLTAAGTNWGVAWLDPDLDSIVRRHWPFPAPGPYPSLPWTAARLAGASLSDVPRLQWLRYYGRDGPWTRLSYRFGLFQPTNYYRDKIVFVGNQPKTTLPDDEVDEFRTPYTRWTGESMGGVEILATAFLNLVNGDWLRRPAPWAEGLVFVLAGGLLGGVLCRMPLLAAGLCGGAFALVTTVGAIAGGYVSNYWFPWLVIAGGQVPCAFVWALATHRTRRPKAVVEAAGPVLELPDTPGYELVNPPFGEGAYGKVWLARNSRGDWRALKAVYLEKFGGNADPYEREYKGISRYQPLSHQHPGLLQVEFISPKQRAGYFYYVMELGDARQQGWESDPATYRPRDLAGESRQAQGQKLPLADCLRIGIALADALDFLHRHGVTHRDIKPQNVIFINGTPKLADMGLVAEIRPPDQTRTYVGTPGYLPPPPEVPGTPQADIYALGMVLYVLSCGRAPAFFPEISTTLAGTRTLAGFFPFNDVVLKACQPDPAQRYASAAEMHRALLEVQRELEGLCG